MLIRIASRYRPADTAPPTSGSLFLHIEYDISSNSSSPGAFQCLNHISLALDACTTPVPGNDPAPDVYRRANTLQPVVHGASNPPNPTVKKKNNKKKKKQTNNKKHTKKQKKKKQKTKTQKQNKHKFWNKRRLG